MTTIDKIRAEIERLYAEHSSKYGMDEAAIVLDKLEDFIDSLHEEPDKGLEEAAMNYIAPIENEDGLKVINFSGQDIKDAFIAGSEWRYQKDRAEFAKLKAKEWMSGYDEGLSKGKEQMMKDAIAYVAQPDVQAGNIQVPFIRIGRTALFRYGIKVGDKVRIIIVKEDGE